MLRSAAVVVLLFLSSQVSAADLTLEIEGTPNFFRLDGPIESGDLQRLKDVYSSIEDEPDSEFPWASTSTLIVNSPGGSLGEALNLGRWLRENRFSVLLPEDGKCFSACVYLLASGLNRYPSLGAVGVHRPYLGQEPDQGIENSVRAMLSASRSFFEEMNVPPSLADDMFSVPPESLRILSESDLQEYRLNQTDLEYREKDDLALARQYGMTRTEYLEAKRKSEVAIDLLCRLDSTRAMLDCIDEVEESLGLVWEK